MNKALAETCLRYLDGDLSADELQDFGALLVESAEAADMLAQLSLDEQHYRSTPAGSEGDLLPELLKLEASAQPVMRDITTHDGPGHHADRSDPSHNTLKILGDSGFLGYVAGSALRSKPAKWIAAAAVVLLAATLVFVFTGGNENPAPPLAEQGTDQEAQPNTPTRPSVATLTATYNATWNPSAERALARGSDLHAGDCLTLTEGFAEITTSRGAVAILEAPCTVELIDSPNAIRLHTGKLVGVCETESSKGLLVRTPHMDITDLGTRFGVDATHPDATEVHVIEGAVQTVRPNSTDAALVLNAGQAAAAMVDEPEPKPIAFSADRFAAVWSELRSRPTLSGQAVYLAKPPADLRRVASTEHVFVFAERAGVALPTSLTGWLVKPGKVGHEVPEALIGEIASGEIVDSYLIHSATPDEQAESVQGSLHAEICFTRPVVAVQVAGQGLLASDPFLKSPGTIYGSESDLTSSYRGLDSSQFNEGIILSDDRLTLTINLRARYTFDQVRVLVQAAETDAN